MTCLQMILYRKGYGLFDQEQLAKYFHIRVGKKYLKSFNVHLGTVTRHNYDEGLKTIESEDLINRFFKVHNIELRAKAYRESEIVDLKNFIAQQLKEQHDLWVEYKGHRIHSGDKSKGRYIHDCLIESIKYTRDATRVVMVDPDGEHKARYDVSITTLKEALSDKFGRETGIIVIT